MENVDVTAARNARGETLEEFLENYDPARFERPSVTVDVALVTHEGEVLMIRRGNHPNIGMWALPGGFIEMHETLEQSAARELYEETGLDGVALVPLGMYGEPTRDPRTRIITAAFTARASRDELGIKAGDDAAGAALFAAALKPVGEVEIPERRERGVHVALPCGPCGAPTPGKGQGFELTLAGADESGRSLVLGARLAVDSKGTDVLLGGIDGTDGIAGDHALIVFAALKAHGWVR